MARVAHIAVIASRNLFDRNWPSTGDHERLLRRSETKKTIIRHAAALEKGVWRDWVSGWLSSLQIHCRKAVIEFRFLKAAIRQRVQPTQTSLFTWSSKCQFISIFSHSIKWIWNYPDLFSMAKMSVIPFSAQAFMIFFEIELAEDSVTA
ncbi:MAG: hypothetical protein Q8K07_17350 [Methylicorpusculum sp.]|uniref:hypothetical protein n=1 Tax=Methylicorpusculum sp. TaxID=2713644 RepID=UPI002730A492|nr:hypothetical protein [Methylicorpusculum sp.]MDP2203789.1 hypothetical protein [Methylicorpusculum sp.]